jgi:chemosensory pili system protein ChpA (sensor histidine kinase/response regulator)
MRDVRPERDDSLAYFAPEARDHLDVMSRCLLALEQGRATEDNVASLFRAVHTLKGAAYVVGHTAVGDLAHAIEDVLAAVRHDRGSLAPAAIDLIHAGIEAARRRLGLTGDSVDEGVPEAYEETLARLRAVAPHPARGVRDAGAHAGASAGAVAASASPAPPRAPATAPSGLSASPSRAPGTGMRLDLLVNLAGELVVARRRLEGRLHELERVDEVLSQSRARMARAVGELEDLHRHGAGPETARVSGTGGGGEAAAGSVWHNRASGYPLADGDPDPHTAVSLTDFFSELELDRFDHVDLLGRSLAEITADLAVVHSQVTGLTKSLSEDTARVQRLTASLRGEITRARLVPVERVFARVARQVRETAKSAGKAVGLQVSGESVSIDSAIVDHLAGPILHLLQNAITHGIEAEGERRARGKPPQGTLSLRAYHRGGFIHIEMSDDGRGIDTERLKAAAVRQGLVPPEVTQLMDEAEALDLIFLPGLSTASAVTPSAGRGIGLDVVRTTVGRLNGDVTVTTAPGAGTQFTMRLPLTVIVSEALLVRVASETLAIPVNAVRRVVALPFDHVERAGRGERVWVDDRPLDLLRLDQLFGLTPGEPAAKLWVVALRTAGRAVALAVDEVLGKEEIFVRSLGEFMEGVGPFGGATISDDGRVILLLDPVRLLEMAEPLIGIMAARRGAPPSGAASALEPPVVRRILLIDDSISVRKFVGQMLERAGFAVVTAADGVEGLRALEETPVHLVITDLEMPRLNGFELIQQLRRRAETRDLPIVVLTTRVGAKHLDLARWLGATDYVAKPVDESAFVRLIDSLAVVTSRAVPPPAPEANDSQPGGPLDAAGAVAPPAEASGS